jgi:hypothetical protein
MRSHRVLCKGVVALAVSFVAGILLTACGGSEHPKKTDQPAAEHPKSEHPK